MSQFNEAGKKSMQDQNQNYKIMNPYAQNYAPGIASMNWDHLNKTYQNPNSGVRTYTSKNQNQSMKLSPHARIHQDYLMKKAVQDFAGVYKSVVRPEAFYPNDGNIRRNYPKPWLGPSMIAEAFKQNQHIEQNLQGDKNKRIVEKPKSRNMVEQTKLPSISKKTQLPIPILKRKKAEDPRVERLKTSQQVLAVQTASKKDLNKKGKSKKNVKYTDYVQPWRRQELLEQEVRASKRYAEEQKLKKTNANTNTNSKPNFPKSQMNSTSKGGGGGFAFGGRGMIRNYPKPWLMEYHPATPENVYNEVQFVENAINNNNLSVDWNANKLMHQIPLNFTQKDKLINKNGPRQNYNDEALTFDDAIKYMIREDHGYNDMFIADDNLKKTNKKAKRKPKKQSQNDIDFMNFQVNYVTTLSEPYKGAQLNSSQNPVNHEKDNTTAVNKTKKEDEPESNLNCKPIISMPLIIKNGEFHGEPSLTSTCSSSSSTDEGDAKSWKDNTINDIPFSDNNDTTKSDFTTDSDVSSNLGNNKEVDQQKLSIIQLDKAKDSLSSVKKQNRKSKSVRNTKKNRSRTPSSPSQRRPPSRRSGRSTAATKDSSVKRTCKSKCKQNVVKSKPIMVEPEAKKVQELYYSSCTERSSSAESESEEKKPKAKQPADKYQPPVSKLSYTIISNPHGTGGYKKIFQDGTESNLMQIQTYVDPLSLNPRPNNNLQVKSIIFSSVDLRPTKPTIDFTQITTGSNHGSQRSSRRSRKKYRKNKNTGIIYDDSDQDFIPNIKSCASYTIQKH